MMLVYKFFQTISVKTTLEHFSIYVEFEKEDEIKILQQKAQFHSQWHQIHHTRLRDSVSGKLATKMRMKSCVDLHRL